MELDLFATPEPPRDEPRVYSVSDVTRAVRSAIEDGVGVVWVEGEVSNFRRQASGHQYFTLKDATSQLACVLFARGGARRGEVPLADGMQVQVRGTMTVYEARGQYQLNVQLVQAGGAGLLQAKFEALKRKLDAEGLFDAESKKALPAFPTSVAIVTSPTGAALRDMLNVLGRRAPWLRVVVSPVRVQGEGAAAEVAAAIGELNRFEDFGLDPVGIIVIARGGGSVEDLWAFNEEVVARAMAASEIPVVSAIGHEIDFTIADFVADLRAPTPSAAAELIVADAGELLRHLAQTEMRLTRRLRTEVERCRGQLAVLTSGALHREPRARLDGAEQELDAMEEALARAGVTAIGSARRAFAEAAGALREHRPDHRIALLRERFGRLQSSLRLLAPEATLRRGYSITSLESGAVVSSAKSVAPGTHLVTRFHDGSVASTVD